GVADTTAACIHRLASQPLVRWARKLRIRAAGRRSLRSRAPADLVPRHRATAECRAAHSSRESLRRCTISLRDTPSDNLPLVRRAPEIVRLGIWFPASKQCLVVLPRAMQTGDPAVCAAN